MSEDSFGMPVGIFGVAGGTAGVADAGDDVDSADAADSVVTNDAALTAALDPISSEVVIFEG